MLSILQRCWNRVGRRVLVCVRASCVPRWLKLIAMPVRTFCKWNFAWPRY